MSTLVNSLVLAGIFLVVPTALILPGWEWIGRRRTGTALFLMPLVGVVAWIAVAAAKIGGHQGLGNLMEPLGIAFGSVLLAYVGFVLGRFYPGHAKALTVALFAVLLIAVVALRLFMPEIPE